MAQDIKEAGREVGKLAEGAADKTGEMVGGAAADTRNFFARLKDNASRLAKNAGEKMKSKVTSEDVEMDDFGRHAMEEAEEAAAAAAAEAAEEMDGALADVAEENSETGEAVFESSEDMNEEESTAGSSEEMDEAEESADDSAEEMDGSDTEDAPVKEASGTDAEESSKETEEDPYKDEYRAVDAMFSEAEEDSPADRAVPAEPAAPADAENEL